MATFTITRRHRACWGLLIVLTAGWTCGCPALGQWLPGPGELPEGWAGPDSDESLRPFFSITGQVSYSVDAKGSNNAQHAIRVLKPNAFATVSRAYLLAAATPFAGIIPNGGIKINGQSVHWEASVTGAFCRSYRADVTSLIKPTVDAAAPGITQFLLSEPYGPDKIDGEILAVVFDDPSVAGNRTVALLFGAQAPTGDTFTIHLFEPIDPTSPSALAEMGLGISWSTGGTQRSQIDVQGARMTSSAGGYNDGAFANGSFLTGGGVGDSTANPPDPYAAGNSGYDDELYSLLPYITATTTEITVFTLNPSNNDNIFFAHFYLSTAALVSQAIMLEPLTAQHGVGEPHTLTATVQDFYGNPIINTAVTFLVVAGPNAGDTGAVFTNSQGQATWGYTGDGGVGTDQVQASFLDAAGDPIYSNVVTCLWYMVNQPPVADAGGPYTGWVNAPVQLDGSGSWDPDQDIVAYQWDLDNDGEFDDATGVAPSWTYHQPATYAIGLLVRDSVGHEDTDFTTVAVGNHDPVADPGGPYGGPANGMITLDGTGSYDPDPNDPIAYAWDLDNDGEFDDSTLPKPVFAIGAVPPGTVFTVCLKVTDSFGAFHVGCTTVTVENQAPICQAGGPYSAECAGPTTSLLLDGSGSHDPDPGDTLTYAWTSNCPGAHFDDPTLATPLLTLDGGCNVTCQVFLTVTDKAGASSACSAAVTVTDTTPPTFTHAPAAITLECDGSGNVGEIQSWLSSAAANDVCGAVTITNNFQGLSDECGATGSAIVTWTATDACGRQATHSATVTVLDTTPPWFTHAPPDVTFECDGTGNSGDIQAWLGSALAADACGGVMVTHDFAGLSDECGATGSAVVTWTATDACGLTAVHAAVVTVADTTPPVFTTAPGNIAVDCGPAGQAQIQTWLNSAAASDACGSVTITNDFPGLSGGSVLVTWTATDDCGLQATHSALCTIQDNTPPQIECPPDAYFERGDFLCDGEVLAWLNSASATDNCDPNPVITQDAPPCGFPPGSTTLVTWTATDASGNTAQCSATVTIGPGTPGQPVVEGSLLICPNVEIRWNAAGLLIQDTFVTLSNEFPEDVRVQIYFMNGDPPLAANPGTGERAHLGWNRVGNTITLTGSEPTYWSLATGQPKGVTPFPVLDPGLPKGRPDPEDPSGTTRMLRGAVAVWAVNTSGHEISWNHLAGGATIVDYDAGAAWEYPAWAFAAECVPHGEELLDCTSWNPNGTCCTAEVIPGVLEFDGFQYDFAPGQLLLSFVASGATAFSGPGTTVTHEGDLTLYVMDKDLRQDNDGPTTTRVEITAWNQNEVSFSGLTRCITYWDQALLSTYGSYFLRSLLQTDLGRARVDGLASPGCTGSVDAALIGVAARVLAFQTVDRDIVGGAGRELTGEALGQTDLESARLQHDLPTASEEQPGPPLPDPEGPAATSDGAGRGVLFPPR